VFIAAGVSVPDLWSSISVLKSGHGGDMVRTLKIDLRIIPCENRAELGTSMFQISLKLIFSGKLVLP
jgi:Ca2+/Na+ antiporter